MHRRAARQRQAARSGARDGGLPARAGGADHVVKHADADNARVTVTSADGRLEVEVADDGGGFDATAATTGFGLEGMRERVALSGGQLTITPTASGTTVRATLVLPGVDDARVQRVRAG